MEKHPGMAAERMDPHKTHLECQHRDWIHKNHSGNAGRAWIHPNPAGNAGTGWIHPNPARNAGTSLTTPAGAGKEQKNPFFFFLRKKLRNPFIAQRKGKIPTEATPGHGQLEFQPRNSTFPRFPGESQALPSPWEFQGEFPTPQFLTEQPRGVSCSTSTQFHPKSAGSQLGFPGTLPRIPLLPYPHFYLFFFHSFQPNSRPGVKTEEKEGSFFSPTCKKKNSGKTSFF